MAVSFSDRLSVNPDVLFRVLGDEAVLVNLQTQRYLGLNGAGTRMWTLLGSASSIQDAYDQLLGEYDVDGAQLRADLEAFIDRLMEQALVTTGPASAEAFTHT